LPYDALKKKEKEKKKKCKFCKSKLNQRILLQIQVSDKLSTTPIQANPTSKSDPVKLPRKIRLSLSPE
jgi:hypothetical protein